LVLTPVAALPVSVVLLGQPSNNVTPPDPCIQFNPQPMLSQVLSGTGSATNTPVLWNGHFTEQLQEPTSGTPGVAPNAWLVDVVYNLNGQLPTVNGGTGVCNGLFNVSGTARETLTPVDASGHPLASAQVWVSNDSISSRMTVLPTAQANPVANNFTFTTDTVVHQTLTPLVATVVTTPTPQSWTATVTSHATGAITEELVVPAASATDQINGSISLQDQINATLSPVVPAGSTIPVTQPWQIGATFDGSGTFSEPLPTVTTAIVVEPSGTLELTGSLSETITPPGSTLTTLLNSSVAASVSFWATSNPSPTPTPVPMPAPAPAPSPAPTPNPLIAPLL
jgi:hypothetical protein